MGTVSLEPVSTKGDHSELFIKMGQKDLAILKIVKNELQVVKQLPGVSFENLNIVELLNLPYLRHP